MHTPEPLHLPPLDRNVRHKSHIKFRSTPLFIDTPNSHSKLRLLSKHIKTNEISQIIGSSHLSTTNLKGDIEVAEAEKRESEANITLLKKKINETRDIYNRKEQEMNRLKDEVDKLKGDEGFTIQTFSKGHNKLDQLKRALELQKLKLEEALASKNTYESMLDRTKKDKLVDQVKSWKIEKELTAKSKAFALEFTHAVRAQQFKKQTDHVLDEVIKQVEDEDRKRQDNLYMFEKAVFAKEDAEKTREERANRNETMAQSVAKEVAHNDEKQYQSLLLVHKFLHLFMKKQMEDEMKKHEKIELAFQRIRAAVGITDAHQFVDKFVKREEAYRELLMSIASYEKRLEGSKKHHEDLQKKILLLKEKNVALEKQRVEQKTGSDQLNEAYKELREKTETAQTAKIKLEQSYAWAIRILLKIDKAQQTVGPKYTEMFSRGKAGPALLHVIQAVAQHTKTLQEKNYEKVLDEIDATKIGAELTKKEFISKNMRVKRDDISPIVITTTPKSETSHTRSHSRSASRANTPYEQSPMLQKPDHIEGVDKDEEDENIELQFSIKRKEIKTKHSKHFQVGTLQKKVLERLLEKEKEK